MVFTGSSNIHILIIWSRFGRFIFFAYYVVATLCAFEENSMASTHRIFSWETRNRGIWWREISHEENRPRKTRNSQSKMKDFWLKLPLVKENFAWNPRILTKLSRKNAIKFKKYIIFKYRARLCDGTTYDLCFEKFYFLKELFYK